MIRYFLEVVLEDDNTSIGGGGIAFVGETVADFIGDMEISETAPLSTLNAALVVCGIKPINEIIGASEVVQCSNL